MTLHLTPVKGGRDAENVFAAIPANVVVLAARVAGSVVGLTTSTFTGGVSFDPPAATVAIRAASGSWRALRRAQIIGVSMLARGQSDIAKQVASRRPDKFGSLSLEHDDAGAVFLHGAAVWMRARLSREITVGDHVVAILAIEAAQRGGGAEHLTYHDRMFDPAVEPALA